VQRFQGGVKIARSTASPSSARSRPAPCSMSRRCCVRERLGPNSCLRPSFVADVVAATAAPGAGGRVYNIGGGARVSLNSTLERLAAIAGRPLDVRRRGREDGDVRHTGADIADARDQLGFAPATSLEQGLAAEFDWVLARAAVSPPAAAPAAHG
jgi:hypothetical protein